MKVTTTMKFAEQSNDKITVCDESYNISFVC